MLIRADPDEARALLLRKIPKFLDFFSDRRRILEVGSGRGEFLQACKARGLKAEGIEPHAPSRREARALGVTVHNAKALPWMRRHARSYDAFYLSNVIEHLEIPEARRFLKLVPKGAKLALTTSNPECLDAMLRSFWSDPEHTRPYAPRVIHELLTEAGFDILRLEADEDTRPQGPLRTLIRAFRRALIGPYFGPSEIFAMAVKRRER